MNILISGGSGFLGSALTQQLINNPINGEPISVTWLSRSTKPHQANNVQILTYDALKTTSQAFDIIINLAGAGIADSRWTQARRQELLASRLKPTQAIIDYLERISIAHTPTKPKLLISGSAIGWYGGYSGDEANIALDETSPARSEFQHDLCQQWENLAKTAQNYNVPVSIVRTGVVFDPKGGMLTRLLTPFKLGLGGKLGNGQQAMSWISRTDWVRAVRFIIERAANNENLASVYNLTHPDPITNADFTKALGQWLHRPTWFTVPKFVLKLLLGEMATLLVDGQKVLPNHLLNQGFKFQHQTVLQALENQ